MTKNLYHAGMDYQIELLGGPEDGRRVVIPSLIPEFKLPIAVPIQYAYTQPTHGPEPIMHRHLVYKHDCGLSTPASCTSPAALSVGWLHLYRFQGERS